MKFEVHWFRLTDQQKKFRPAPIKHWTMEHTKEVLIYAGFIAGFVSIATVVFVLINRFVI